MFSSFSGSFKFGRRRIIGPPPFVGFTNFTFTSGGVEGRTGPNLVTLLNSYDTSANPWLLNTDNFNMITNGYQLWTVPTTGTYRITARGAQGTPSEVDPPAGGRGAIITGDFNLTAGEKLQILVGQTAGFKDGQKYRHSAGGGGSFVVRYTGETNIVDDILVIAGGGGGTGSTTIDPQGDAQTGTSGGRARRNGNNAGGTGGIDGNGGNIGNATSNGAGGGFLTNGAASNNAQGLSFLNGGIGGAVNTSWNLNGGGFGGGGSPNNGALSRMSGGGGFSGGGASNTGSDGIDETNMCGGGGGSYNSGDNSAALGGDDGNYGGGSVYIELL
jgi:hypothetical protein